METIEYNKKDVIDIINSARDYGYEDDVLFDFLIKGKGITQNDIQEYCNYFLTIEAHELGYGFGDYKESLDYLTEKIEQYGK